MSGEEAGARSTGPAPAEAADDVRLPADVLGGIPASALRPVWDSSPALISVTWGPEHLLAYQNRASRRVLGARPLGVPLWEAFDGVRPGDGGPVEQVYRTGVPVEVPAGPVGVPDAGGEQLVLTYVLAPLGDPPRGVVITALDVTAGVRAQREAARTQLLADIGRSITSASDAARGLKALTDALVPGLADLAAVYVAPDHQPDGGPALPPEVMTLSEQLSRLGPPPPPSRQTGASPWDPVLRAGRPVIIPVDAVTMPDVAPDPRSVAWLTAAGARSIAVAPLVVAGTLTGALLLLAAGERDAYRDGDLPFLEDVAARAGSAIAQLRTLRRQRELALDLQRALLPAAPRVLTGMTAVTRYVAGAPDVEVGGDWWDLYDLGAGRVALGIGDVSGRGVPAAAVMGQARAVMRAAGHARLDPVDVLGLLDAQLADILAVPDAGPGEPVGSATQAPVRFATAWYGVVEPSPLRLRLANAGHLPLLVRSADGAVRRVQAPPGPPLGVGFGGYEEVSEPLAPDDTLLLFTDGLVESRTLDIDDGLQLLSDAFAACGGHDELDVVADAVLEAMERRQGYGPDDVALVVARIDPA